MSKVKAKFKCTQVTTFEPYGDQPVAQQISLMAVTAKPGDESENHKFWKATPSGKVEMLIQNPEGQIFEPGKEYYLTFEEA